MVTATRSTLTAAEAISFNRYSAANASQVQARLSCGCEPYKDVFTYNRWRAQGYQVMRGQKAVKLPIIIEKEEDGEVKKRFWTAAVFCRHQVKAIGAPEPAPAPAPAPEPTPAARVITSPGMAWLDKEPTPAVTAKIAEIQEQQREIKPAPATNNIMDGWRLIK